VKPHRKFLVILALAYLAGAGGGLALFRSPGLSKAYLQQYGHEHERYRRIAETPEYQRYRERPALNPLNGPMAQKAAFALDYEQRPALRAERRRIMAYVVWFKILNMAALAALALHFITPPLLRFLDQHGELIRAELAEAETARGDALSKQAEAQAVLDTWPNTEEQIRIRTERALEASLAEVREQTRFAREQITREIKNRRAGELSVAARTLKEELVAQAVEDLEEKYRREATPERQSANVDQFVRFMGYLS
jgi:F0F1-type ATP synthase membrane subunit b/b'